MLSEFPKILIQVGIEAGYNKGLKNIRKGTIIEEVISLAKLLTEYGMSNHVLYSFIIGFPEETENDCLKTIRTAIEVIEKYGIKVNCGWWLPFPLEIHNGMKYLIVEEDYYFNLNGWNTNPKIFNRMHPLIDPKFLNILIT